MILDALKNYPKIRTFPVFVFLFLTFVFCLDFYSISSIYKGFQTVNNGLQTCFSRVNQSFVSKVFSTNKNSNHLKPEFFSVTEECFGDVLKRSEPLFNKLNKEIDPKINSLVSEVYWIHKDLKGNSELDKLKTRFKKIETINIKALEELERLDNEGNKKIEQRKNWFYLSYLCLFFALLIEIFISSRIQTKLGHLEEKQDKNKENINSILNYPVITTITKPNFINNFQNQSTVVNLPVGLKSDESGKTSLEKTYLEDTLTKLIDLFSGPLFSKGIKFEMEVNEDLVVYISNEVLEQSLFSFLNFSINNFPEDSKARKISFRSKVLGETAVFEIKNSGVVFGEEFLKDAGGFNLNGTINKRLLDLKIGSELIKENFGKVYFENYSGEPVIRIQLKSTKLKDHRTRTRLIRNAELEVLA